MKERLLKPTEKKPPFKKYLLIFLLLPLFLIYTHNSEANSLVKAGTKIANTAVATYRDSLGFRYTITSNTVVLEVAKVYGILITPDYQELRAFTGGEISIPFLLTNTGNTKDSYTLFASNLLGDSGELEDLGVYIDQNNNGVVDVGEPLYDNDNPPLLESGESLPLILKALVPSSALSGDYKVRLGGKSVGNSSKADIQNVAVVRVSSEGFVQLRKRVSDSNLFPGDILKVEIEFNNPASLPVRGANILTDFNNDGVPEGRLGILIWDDISPVFTLKSVGPVPTGWTVVYRGEGDSFWKDSLGGVEGSVRSIGLFIPDSGSGALEPDQRGVFSFELTAKGGIPPQTVKNLAKAMFGSSSGSKTSVSNPALITVEEVASVVADDVDDGNSYTGSGSPDDPDDLMVVEHVVSGEWIEFENEVWNLGNAPDVINLLAEDLPPGLRVAFYSLDGLPLSDTNGDGLIDVGPVDPSESIRFITKVYVPKGRYSNLTVKIRAVSSLNPSVSDLTFDRIVKAEPVLVRVLAKVQTIVQGTSELKEEPLYRQRVVVYEYDRNGNLVRSKLFWTDNYGTIIYDENGKRCPVYNWMRYGYTYRIGIFGEINGFDYYLMDPIRKDYFDAVSSPGEEACWSLSGREVDCSSDGAKIHIRVEDDGTKVLLGSLDPAGFVYDAVTGERVNGACIKFYKCSDSSCRDYSLVDPLRLDLYPDGLTLQENPQVSGPTDVNGNGVGKTDGAFEFRFLQFNPSTDTGWYFVAVDFDCSFPAADPTLSDCYFPVKPNPNGTWSPYSGKPYLGEKFYVDQNFPGAVLMRIPLLPFSFKKLEVRKSVSPSSASIGDFVKWTITVRNPNSKFTVYNVKVKDVLPRGLKYKKGLSAFKPSISLDGRVLTWSIGDLAPNSSVEITFYTVVTPGIKEGNLKNLAYASGWSDVSFSVEIPSNEAFAYLKVSKGVFTDRALIVGKVFIDDNKNGVQDNGEVGVEGVKIYMEDGRFVVTDSEGKYHFDDVSPGTHVLKVDETTIPPNTELTITANRNANSPGTFFADVFPGDLFKVNFALTPKKVPVRETVFRESLRGSINIERVVEPVIVDPSTGEVGIKNFLVVENTSDNPLYEVNYSESSPYVPREGTTYLNGSPFEEPTFSKKNFSWKVPLIQPKERVEITWISDVPETAGKARGEVAFSLKPYEGSSITVPVSVPLEFEVLKPDVYRLTVYFPFGSYQLTSSAKKSLREVAEFLRKRHYKLVFVKVVGHADSVRVGGGRKGYSSNEELSLKRAEAVKAYLKELLIDVRKVRVEK